MVSITGLHLLVVFASSITAFHTVFDSIKDGVPEGWAFERAPHVDEQVRLKVALKQQNVEAFEQRLLNISDPDHSQYGKHLLSHQIEALLRPSDESVQGILRWLEDHNVKAISKEKEWINFKTSVGTANKMLNTSFLWYKNKHEGALSLRTLEYSVPHDLAGHIDLIQPTTRFGTGRPMRSTLHEISRPKNGSLKNPPCSSTITPSCLLDLYNIKYKANPHNGNKVGFASFLEQYMRYTDLRLFEEKLAPYTKGRNFSFISLHGGLNNQSSIQGSGEANLDGQYLFAVGHPIPVTEISTAGRGPLVPDLDQPNPANNGNEPYLEYLTALLKLPDSEIPQVISHSYGENEQSVPASYNKKVCNLFSQLTARGITVLFSSGDFGPGDACVSNNGTNKPAFQPSFPASCPWLTSVGATTQIPESAASFSGGGFSGVHARPPWQDQAVSSYLSSLPADTFSGLYNARGRGIPDVSAQGRNFVIYEKGAQRFVSGTSASAPVFAAVVALMNSERRDRGLPPMGFLNPWLYKVAGPGGALNDVRQGGSVGCAGEKKGSARVPGAGWNATEGWDPVTGLGTPDLGRLMEAMGIWEGLERVVREKEK